MIYLADELEVSKVRERTLETQQGLNITTVNPAVARLAERKREWFLANKEKAYELNKKYAKKYVTSAKAKETRRAWREANAQRLREYHATYYARRKESVGFGDIK